MNNKETQKEEKLHSYKAQIDRGPVIFLLIFPLISLGITKWCLKLSGLELVLLVVILYAVVGFLLGGMYTTRYIIDDDALVIKLFCWKQKVPYHRINRMERNDGSWAIDSPGREKLVLWKDKEKIIGISPKTMEKFEKELRKVMSVEGKG